MIHSNLQTFDNIPFSQRRITPEGFLEAPATLARTGIHIYRAGEFPSLVAKGMDANKVLRLHRPSEELFNPATVQKAEGMPVIVEPHRMVTAENWKDLAVGDVHGIHSNGNLMDAEKIVVRDQDAIDALQSGKKYLSNGYTFDMDLTPGTTADGQAYDGIQRNIVPNHVAICDSPRGGTQCQIADATPTGEQRKMIIQIDGISVEVGNDTAVTAVQKVIKERDELKAAKPVLTVKTGDTSSVMDADQVAKALEGKDAEIKTLKGQIKTPEQIQQEVDKQVALRLEVIGDATKVIKDFKAEGKTVEQIKREVVTSVLAGDTAAKAVATALLSGSTVEAADSSLLSTVYKASVAAFGTGAAAAQQTVDPDPAVARAMAGDTNTTSTSTESKLVGRDAFLARQNVAWQEGLKKNKKK